MYALCPECDAIVEDHGRGGPLKCESCGTRFKSRRKPKGIEGNERIRIQDQRITTEGMEETRVFEIGEPLTMPNRKVKWKPGEKEPVFEERPWQGADEPVFDPIPYGHYPYPPQYGYDYPQPPQYHSRFPPPEPRKARAPRTPQHAPPSGEQPTYQHPPPPPPGYPQIPPHQPPPPGPYPYYPPPYPYYQRPPSGTKDLLKVVGSLISIIGLFCFFSFYFLSLLALGPALLIVLPEMMTHSLVVLVPTFFPPFIMIVGYIPGGIPAAAYFIFIVTAIFASVFWLFFTEGREAWYLITKKPYYFMMPPGRTKNSFFMFPQIFLAFLFFNVVVVFILYLFGSEPTTPDSLGDETPLWYLMYGLANASVWEEIASRVLFIGMPLAFIELFRRNFRDEKQYEFKNFILGGKIKIGYQEMVFILISSSVFGLAHIAGWDVWKFFPTFVSGLAFGYLFLTKGLHVAILLHFAFDYIAMPLELLNPGIAGQLLYGFGLFILILLGMLFFIYFIIIFAFRLITGKQFVLNIG
jgi:hypothetical protein